MDRRGRAIVLMPGPYDNFCRKVNGIDTYDVFGSHRQNLTIREWSVLDDIFNASKSRPMSLYDCWRLKINDHAIFPVTIL